VERKGRRKQVKKWKNEGTINKKGRGEEKKVIWNGNLIPSVVYREIRKGIAKKIWKKKTERHKEGGSKES